MCGSLPFVIIPTPAYGSFGNTSDVASHSLDLCLNWDRVADEVVLFVGDAVGAVIIDSNAKGVGVIAGQLGFS